MCGYSWICMYESEFECLCLFFGIDGLFNDNICVSVYIFFLVVMCT